VIQAETVGAVAREQRPPDFIAAMRDQTIRPAGRYLISQDRGFLDRRKGRGRNSDSCTEGSRGLTSPAEGGNSFISSTGLPQALSRACTHKSRLFGNRWPPQTNVCGLAAESQSIFCRRRHQTSKPPPAKVRPGRPEPMMGPGTGVSAPDVAKKEKSLFPPL